MSGPYIEQNRGDIDNQVLMFSYELEHCRDTLNELIRLMSDGEILLLSNQEFEQLLRVARPLTAMASQFIDDTYDPVDY